MNMNKHKTNMNKHKTNILGGSAEDKKREFTFNDFYRLNLHKLDTFELLEENVESKW